MLRLGAREPGARRARRLESLREATSPARSAALSSLCCALALACGPRADSAQRATAPVVEQTTRPRPVPGTTRADFWSPRQVAGYEPRRSIRLVAIPTHDWDGDDAGSAHFRDVMEHTSPANRWTSPDAWPSTIGHETHHGLTAERELRGDSPAEFFYFSRGYGAYVRSPRQNLRLLRHEGDGTPVYTPNAHTNLGHVRTFVPEGARALARGRYETYLLDDKRETYAVLYLFDEWNAYIAGARIAIEAHAAGYYDRTLKETLNPDGSRSRITHIGVLDGMIDFLYFSSAGLLALADREPEFLADNEQLRAVYAVFAEETMRWFQVGGEIDLFRGTHGQRLLDHLRTSPESERVRVYLTTWLGAEWTRRVFGW